MSFSSCLVDKRNGLTSDTVVIESQRVRVFEEWRNTLRRCHHRNVLSIRGPTPVPFVPMVSKNVAASL
jgi:hypothetical protein